MPRKHQPAYASIRPAHSTLSSASRATASNAPQTSVNERIQQLRREQAPRATSQRRDEVTEVVTTRTVPPHLRRILQLAEVDAPKPKPGSRQARDYGAARPGERRPPGPAAPSSWLNTSGYALRGGGRPAELNGRLVRREGFGRLARCYDEEFRRFPGPRSLMHQCLRTFASNWQELAEYEQHYIASLPIPLREMMLSYLALYGDRGDLDSKTFKILFQDEKENEASVSAWEEVRFLDLSGLLCDTYTLKDLEKSLHRKTGIGSAAAVTSSIADLSLSSTSKGKQKAVPQIAESWEDEVDDLPPSPPAIPLPNTTLLTPIFPNLTRLSLAHPGPAASWTDLLSISPHLKTLTHLSLAYWPRPSTTPNAATTSMVSPHGGTVALGGSHFYSDLDDDWHEAANILRRLSKNTYCLQWLDLEGCMWIPALTWDPRGMPPAVEPRTNNTPITPAAAQAPSEPSDEDEEDEEEEHWPASSHSGSSYPSPTTRKKRRHTPPAGPDFTTSWRQLTYLRLAQGWIPSDARALQALPSGVICIRLMQWLRETEMRARDPPLPASNGTTAADSGVRVDAEEAARRKEAWDSIVRAGKDRSQLSVEVWVEREGVIRGVGARVQGVRKSVGGLWCVIDYGWG